jgi:hypothetical protein
MTITGILTRGITYFEVLPFPRPPRTRRSNFAELAYRTMMSAAIPSSMLLVTLSTPSS